MTWVKTSVRMPESEGWYQVVKLNKGSERDGFFAPVLPTKSIKFMQYKQSMKLEQDFVDRCVFVKFKCFITENGVRIKSDEILYWYELDAIPESDTR